MNRVLNEDQIDILKLLYKFRFGTTTLLDQALKFSSRTSINARLKILERDGYIGRRYEKSYKLIGKPASYFLLKKSFVVLKGQPNVSDRILKNIYKDRSATDKFINSSLDLFAIYNHLKEQYEGNLRFFTKSQLADLSYFPRPLPDAYIRLQADEGEKHFFLDVYPDSYPIFAVARRLRQYVEYSETEKWRKTKTELPMLLAVCESSTIQRQIRKRASKTLGDSFDLSLALKLELLGATSPAWQTLSDPDNKLPLHEI